MSGGPAEDSYELRTTSTVRRALSGTLPEAVAAAAYEFITGPLLTDPHRIGKRLLPPMGWVTLPIPPQHEWADRPMRRAAAGSYCRLIRYRR